MNGMKAVSACGGVACPGCGLEIGSGKACGNSCGSAGGCSLLACPHCGRAVPHPNKAGLAYRLARWWWNPTAAALYPTGADSEGEARGIPVPSLATGQGASILSVVSKEDGLASRLAALGLVPGAQVRLRQRRPAVVLELDGTLLALDAELAAAIRVGPQGN